MKSNSLRARLEQLHTSIGNAEHALYVEDDSRKVATALPELKLDLEDLAADVAYSSIKEDLDLIEQRSRKSWKLNGLEAFPAGFHRLWSRLTGLGPYAAAIDPFVDDTVSARAAYLRLSMLKQAMHAKPGLPGHVGFFDVNDDGKVTIEETKLLARELGLDRMSAVIAANAIVLGLAPKTKSEDDERSAGKILLEHIAQNLGLRGKEAAVLVSEITGGTHAGDQGFKKDGTLRIKTIAALKAEAGEKDFINEKDLFRAMRRTMMDDPNATGRDAAVSVLELLLWLRVSPFTDPETGERVLNVKGSNDQIDRFYAQNQEFQSITAMRLAQKHGGTQLAEALGADPEQLVNETNVLPVLVKAISFAKEIGAAKSVQAAAKTKDS